MLVTTTACCSVEIEKYCYHIGIHWCFIHQWLIIMQLIQQKIEKGSKSLLSWGQTKTKGKLAQGTRTKEFLENEKGAEVVSSTKKRKNHIKTSTQRISVTTEVLLCPRRQKCLLLLLKGINLKERSASIARVNFLYLIHHCHLLLQSLQRQEA